MWRYRFGLALAWLLIPGVIMAQECPLDAPLTVKDLQSGFAGETGTVWTIAPDCSFTVARQIGPKIGDPHRRGRLTGEQQVRLRDLLARAEAAKLPSNLGGAPQTNARRISLAYGAKVSVLNLAPGGGEAGARRAASNNEPAAQMLDLAAAVKDMTGG